jgi:predicted AlkP superfamily pyrophosphatase or phosphodiesterase
MTSWRIVRILFVLALVGISSARAADSSDRHPVLMISIDGMRPDAVLQADRYGLKIPVLRSFLKDGSYAQEVLNVNPTVTNPNHATLVTGVLPREHGIYNNRPFAATAKLPSSYSSYSQIKARTLWRAAKDAGLKTGSIFWPVTAEAEDIDFNLREGSDEDDEKIGDDAIALIEQQGPELLTLHFVALDHRQHESGPFSAEGNAALERIDAVLGRVIAAQKKVHPDSVIAIVSDHGFYTATHQVNLNTALTEAGFITLGGDGPDQSVTSWRAFAWYVGGMAMMVLQDPADRQTRQRLQEYLQKLASDPENGIERIYTRDEIAELGLAPEAELVVAFKDGYRMGNSFTGPLRTSFSGGGHGAFSTRTIRPDMRSSFFITGPGIAAAKNLGMVDIRQIAPTLAGELKIELPAAKLPPLSLRES